jgi:hypothetical protein
LLSRKDKSDILRIEIWMKELAENEYPGEDTPILVSWMSTWQIEIALHFECLYSVAFTVMLF